MSGQLSLFPELEWEEYEYKGKIYRRKNYHSVSYRQKQELIIKIIALLVFYRTALLLMVKN